MESSSSNCSKTSLSVISTHCSCSAFQSNIKWINTLKWEPSAWVCWPYVTAQCRGWCSTVVQSENLEWVPCSKLPLHNTKFLISLSLSLQIWAMEIMVDVLHLYLGFCMVYIEKICGMCSLNSNIHYKYNIWLMSLNSHWLVRFWIFSWRTQLSLFSYLALECCRENLIKSSSP